MTGQTTLQRLCTPMAVLATAFTLGACAASAPPAPIEAAPQTPVVGAPPEPATVPVDLAVRGFTPPHLQGAGPLTRVGLLLPFTARSAAARAEAAQILHAAELALFERADPNVVLLPKDTAGEAGGARAAAEAAIADGADLIIGPLFSAAVRAAGQTAREAGVPMIAFSTDRTVAGDGVYLLSFPPQEEIRRVVDFAASQGATRFAFIGPASAYGQLAYEAFDEAVTANLGEEPEPELAMVELPLPEDAPEDAEPELEERLFETGLVAGEFYDGGVSAMTEAAARLATLGLETLDPAEAALMSGANWTPSPASAFQVVLLPEGGDNLRMLAPVLLYQDIDPLLVKFVGTGLWRDPSLAREPALAHGWFAGPDPAARARFESVFESVFGGAPSRLAGLGYDAASLAALMAAESDFSRTRLETEDGFVGVDGLFRFAEDGLIERGLAVYTVRGGGFRVLDPAPERFGLEIEPADVEPDTPF